MKFSKHSPVLHSFVQVTQIMLIKMFIKNITKNMCFKINRKHQKSLLETHQIETTL